MLSRTDKRASRISFICTYLPRLCGIATFTSDLSEALAGSASCLAIPVNDMPEGYDYPEAVRFTIDQEDLSSYYRAAQYINFNNVDVVSIQHEFGIFGGPAGSHVLSLLEQLHTPVVTTLHTVLHKPTENYRTVMERLADLSDRLIVMGHRGREFLRDIYNIPDAKIDLIPHGTPDFPFVDPNFYRDQFKVAGKRVLLTFGLLHSSKGLENVISALPEIIRRVPDVVFLIIGATHPAVIREEGEAYRLSLQRLARDLGVEEQVIFHNRFVETQELIEFIGAADVYLTPYLNEDQITSGTLAWAVGAGKAVISTPYWYAQELLADDRGILVPFKDPDAVAQAVIRLLTDDSEFHAIRKRAYLYGREMTWANVAHRYMESFAQSRDQRAAQPRAPVSLPGRKGFQIELPSLNLTHLQRLTDTTGIFQFARFNVPDYHDGYTTDDNARALILMVHLEELAELKDVVVENLTIRYMAFLIYAFNRDSGRFRNVLSYEQRRWVEDIGSEDSHGRALWALGELAGRSHYASEQELAGQVFGEALPAALSLESPRAWAFALLGLHEYLRWFSGDRPAREARRKLANRLVALYRNNHSDDWRWFEDRLTYCNARLSHALLVTGHALSDKAMTRMALESLAWLADTQRAEDGHFVPIGSRGFYLRGQEKARFDQQPVEALAMVSACLDAYRFTGEIRWHKEAERAFEWFLGRNDLGLRLADPRTGACHDGLHPDRVNANQGAESTLSYLMSLAEMRLARRVIDARRNHGEDDHGRKPT